MEENPNSPQQIVPDTTDTSVWPSYAMVHELVGLAELTKAVQELTAALLATQKPQAPQ